jgi:hypothetical protein
MRYVIKSYLMIAMNDVDMLCERDEFDLCHTLKFLNL